jgi:hypothetical protein
MLSFLPTGVLLEVLRLARVHVPDHEPGNWYTSPSQRYDLIKVGLSPRAIVWVRIRRGGGCILYRSVPCEEWP